MKVLCERCGALAEGLLEARPGGGAVLLCGACGAEFAFGASAASASASPAPTSPATTSSAAATAATSTPVATSTPDGPPASAATGASIATEPPAPAEPLAATDDEAWAAVVARWDDEEVHRAFLARFGDLDGLAEAGRRYREVLSEKPGDATALRWRDEILKRATAQGLSQLPRFSPPRASPRVYRWAVVGGMVGAMALAAGWLAWRLWTLARG